MKTSFDKYTRLSKGRFGMSSLWMGDDHLVYVRGSGLFSPFTEEYKRYRFRDIQALSVAKTSRMGTAVLLVAGALLCLGLISLMLVLSGDDGITMGGTVFLSLLSIGALVNLGILLLHFVLGPTCVCDIQTSLSRDRLRPLIRYPKTMEVIDRVNTEIRNSQSDLSAGGDSDTGDSRVASVETTFRDRYQVPRSVVVSFVSFVVMGVLCGAALHLENVLLTGVTLFLLVVTSLLLALALIASVRKPTPESIRSVLWVQMGCLFLLLGAGSVFFLILAMEEEAYTIGISGPLEAFTAMATAGGMPAYLTFVALALVMIFSGIAGLLLAGSWVQKIQKMEELSVTAAEKPESTAEENDG